MSAEAEFASITTRLLRDPGVEQGPGFATSPGLRVRGKIFAMLVRGQLVVKPPADRFSELVASGAATLFPSSCKASARLQHRLIASPARLTSHRP